MEKDPRRNISCWKFKVIPSKHETKIPLVIIMLCKKGQKFLLILQIYNVEKPLYSALITFLQTLQHGLLHENENMASQNISILKEFYSGPSRQFLCHTVCYCTCIMCSFYCLDMCCCPFIINGLITHHSVGFNDSATFFSKQYSHLGIVGHTLCMWVVVFWVY